MWSHQANEAHGPCGQDRERGQRRGDHEHHRARCPHRDPVDAAQFAGRCAIESARRPRRSAPPRRGGQINHSAGPAQIAASRGRPPRTSGLRDGQQHRDHRPQALPAPPESSSLALTPPIPTSTPAHARAHRPRSTPRAERETREHAGEGAHRSPPDTCSTKGSARLRNKACRSTPANPSKLPTAKAEIVRQPDHARSWSRVVAPAAQCRQRLADGQMRRTGQQRRQQAYQRQRAQRHESPHLRRSDHTCKHARGVPQSLEQGTGQTRRQ